MSGCASHYGAARITSIPSGATVLNDEDGKIIGVTPFTHVWKNDTNTRRHLIVKLDKEGYYEQDFSFWLSMRHKSKKQALKNLSDIELSLSRPKQPPSSKPQS